MIPNVWNGTCSVHIRCQRHQIKIYQNYSAHFSLPTNVNQINFLFGRKTMQSMQNQVEWGPFHFWGKYSSLNYYCTWSDFCIYEHILLWTYDGSVFKMPAIASGVIICMEVWQVAKRGQINSRTKLIGFDSSDFLTNIFDPHNFWNVCLARILLESNGKINTQDHHQNLPGSYLRMKKKIGRLGDTRYADGKRHLESIVSITAINQFSFFFSFQFLLFHEICFISSSSKFPKINSQQ